MADTKKGAAGGQIFPGPTIRRRLAKKYTQHSILNKNVTQLYGNRGSGMQPEPAQTGALNPWITEYKT